MTSMILFTLAVYAAIYGVSYAYLLHHLANLLAAWLVIVYFFSSGFSIRRFFWRTIEGPDESDVVGGGGDHPLHRHHVKKQP